MAKIKIGWAEVDITPKKGTKIGLAGQFFERITDEVESPISVTAFALESGDEQMIICSCDLVGVANNLVRLVKEKLVSYKEINPDKVIINAIHTHTSYVYAQDNELLRGKETSLMAGNSVQYLKTIIPKDMEYVPLTSGEKGMDPNDALAFLVDKITEAIVCAWENRKEGYYKNEFGRAVVGMCRRVCYDDGSALMWGDQLLSLQILQLCS